MLLSRKVGGYVTVKAGEVPYEQVIQALRHDWAWFQVILQDDEPDSQERIVLVRPLRVSRHEYEPSEHTPHFEDRFYRFRAEDIDGNIYDFKVYEDGAGRQRTKRLYQPHSVVEIKKPA